MVVQERIILWCRYWFDWKRKNKFYGYSLNNNN